MDEWDEEKLDEVIKKKHGSEKSNATDIVSFILKYTSRVTLPLKERLDLFKLTLFAILNLFSDM